MSDLVVLVFPTEAKAEEVRQKLLAMQKEYLIELGDAVIAVKDSKGNIKLNQLINTTAAGAVTGTFWGALIGLIFLMPLAGAALGAASGTLSGYLTDVGIDDKWMKETAAAIQPGTAALFVLVRKVTADKVLDRLKGEGGTVLKTSTTCCGTPVAVQPGYKGHDTRALRSTSATAISSIRCDTPSCRRAKLPHISLQLGRAGTPVANHARSWRSFRS